MQYSKHLAIAAAAAAVVSGAVAPPAWAAQSNQDIVCNGMAVTIRANNNNSSDHGGWSAVQIVSGGRGHLIPTAFSGSAFDVTTNQVIFTFDQVKGGGHANQKQSTVTCTQEMSGTLADLLDPGESPPPGTSLTDQVTFTFTARVIVKSH
jgi:hypothetical protein